VPFHVGDYQITGPASLTVSPGGQVLPHLTIIPSTFYNSQVNSSCDASALPGTTCLMSPSNPVAVNSGSTTTLEATINVPNNAPTGNYTINFHSQDVSGTPSHSVSMMLVVAPDFSLSSTTPSQTVVAGQTTGPYNLTITPVGSSFNNAVTLACSGLPALTQCLFNPSAPVTPGNSSAVIVMTITTTAATPSLKRPVALGFWLMLPGLFVFWNFVDHPRPRRWRTFWIFGLLLLFSWTLVSCGGASAGGGGGSQPGTPAGNYTITVTGTAGSIQHTVVVGLNVSD
jgi:hypothetical protein